MKRNFVDSFELVKESFNNLTAKHQAYYLPQSFQENIIVLKKLCIDYITPKLTTNP